METQLLATESWTLPAPFFTIGLTTYNRATILQKAIQSVLAQSFTEYELLIVDDASSDDTAMVAREFFAPHVRYLRQPTNQGIGAARNRVIQEASGEFTIFLDDDDCFDPDFLLNVYQALHDIEPNVGFAIAGRQHFRMVDGSPIQLHAESYGYQALTIEPGSAYRQAPISGGSGLIVRTKAARQSQGFSSDPQVPEDTDYMVGLSLDWDYVVIPQAIVQVYVHQFPQLTQDRLKTAIHSEYMGDLDTLHYQRLHRLRAYRRAARMFYAAQKRHDGRRLIRKALELAPLSPKTWGLFVLLELNKVLPLPMRARLLRHDRHGPQNP